jgi:hypothetical protein
MTMNEGTLRNKLNRFSLGLSFLLNEAPQWISGIQGELPGQLAPGKHLLTISGELIRFSENRTPYFSQRTEPGIDGLARTNLRFSSQGGP